MLLNKGKNTMYPLTRQLLLSILAIFFVVSLAACGNNTSGPSSQVFSGESAVLTNYSTVQTWGANGYGQLGNGSTNDSHAPVKLGGHYTAVTVGGAHTLALKGDTVWAWGYNGNGQLGNNSTSNSSTPVPVQVSGGGAALSNIIAVAAGGRHSLALAGDGTVWAWGDNTYGQLGVSNATTTSSLTPVQVIGLPTSTTVKQISAGGDFSLALMNDNTVWAWGHNNNRQLGNNTNSTSSAAPVQVMLPGGTTPLSGITAVAAGGSHSLAIDSSGNVWAWGNSVFGQLGDGVMPTFDAQGNQTSPLTYGAVQVLNVTGATAISAGLDHSMAIDGNKNVWAWGYNIYGQLGQLGSGQTQLHSFSPLPAFPTPMQITAFGNTVEFILALGNHSIARTSDGKYWTWGWDAYGQLGDDATTDRSNPMVVLGP
jgi:alpha-tubulin suppressor-like RCC1 family protein